MAAQSHLRQLATSESVDLARLRSGHAGRYRLDDWGTGQLRGITALTHIQPAAAVLDRGHVDDDWLTATLLDEYDATEFLIVVAELYTAATQCANPDPQETKPVAHGDPRVELHYVIANQGRPI
jgi:hypothetical protein